MLKIDVETAESIVNFIYTNSNYHAIICDENGVIIGDSAKTRLGVTHAGAKKILTTNIDRIVVTEEEAKKLGGTVKAGTNLAVKDGTIKIGNFGITGDPLHTEALANIASGLVISRLKEKENNALLHRCATDVASFIEKAALSIQQLSASSQQLASSSEEASHVTKIVTQDINSTHDIIKFIQQVAAQTNLLGLNAAIEAARAGEHGRGFAVVAEEVRKLSDDSRKSASTINEMLNKFRNSIDDVLKVIQTNNKIAQHQASSIQEIASTVEEVRVIGASLVQMAQRY
ncbi:methyl-accepting chemotaxis protein [Dendrosporobacter sp. 1207_IL3150]